LDVNGYTTPGDAICWLDPACSLPRGGDSDVMTVYSPGTAVGVRGPIFDQIFAFGDEEANNIYYFDFNKVQGDPSLINAAGEPAANTTLWESDGSAWSDTFGVGRVASGPEVYVGFISDPQNAIPSATFIIFEQADIPNPVPEPNSTDSAYLTIEYDATRYLSPEMRQLGFTATFRSDTGVQTSVPEPTTLALLGLGLAGLACVKRKSGIEGRSLSLRTRPW
jgi:hypothetical protein